MSRAAETQLVDRLSGGNQQKILVARWLNTKAEIFILDEPTKGIDVGTKVAIYRLINELAGAGKGVILISSDDKELLAMSDRVAIVRRGRIVRIADARGRHQVRPADRSRRIAGRRMKSPFSLPFAGPAIATLLVALFVSLTTDRFLTPGNLNNLALQVSIVALIAIGSTAVIIVGGIDLSPGSAIALLTMLLAMMLKFWGIGFWPAIGLTLLGGAAIGFVNGAITAYLRIPAFITTLAGYSAYRGTGLHVQQRLAGLRGVEPARAAFLWSSPRHSVCR